MGFVSILNDVLGPVMRGPSSSHTAGAYRIARILTSLLGGQPTRVRCIFDPKGSYAPTYKPLGVDLAFAAGVLGWKMEDERYNHSLTAASELGIPIEFAVESLSEADHPNTVLVEMETAEGRPMTAQARSIGGGVVQIYRMEDRDVEITGKNWDVLIVTEEPEQAARRGEELFGVPAEHCKGRGLPLLHFQSDTPISGADVSAVASVRGIRSVSLSPPVFFPQAGESLFSTARGMIDQAEAEDVSLGEIALLYEARLLGKTTAEIEDEVARRYQIMAASVERGMNDDLVDMPLTRPSASRMWEAEHHGQLALGGPATRAAIRAMACMHICNSRGVVCAAPTGGSAGVIPGVLVTVAEEKSLEPGEVTRGLLAASAVGLIVAIRATFAAETAGCQVEIGVAGAMAAAAVVEIAGGTARQAADAAAIALQNTMGTVCDPVQGGCEIPCHTRNAAAAASAFVCADLILGGYRNPIGLDQTIDASYAVGRVLPRELRCTALGGIAATPAARRLRKSDTK